MTKHTIELAGEFSYTRGTRDGDWEATATFDKGTLPTAIVLELAEHGLRQKVADAASQAKNADEALAAMQKAVDALVAGEWSSRGSGEGVTEEVRVARQVTREVFKAKVGGKSPAWAEFTGLGTADANAKLDAMFAANEAMLRPAVDAKLKELAKARERKAGLVADFTI